MSSPKPTTSRYDDYFLVYVIGGILALASATGIVLLLVFAHSFDDSKNVHVIVGLVGSMVLLAFAVVILIYPTILERQIIALTDFPTAIRDVHAKITDLDVIRREHGKAGLVLESASKGVAADRLELAKIHKQLSELLGERQAMEEKLTKQRQELRQEATLLQKQLDSWIDSTVAYLESIERALNAQAELSPEFRKALEHTLKNFLRSVNPLGFELVRPQEGDFFDERVHRVEGREIHPTVAPDHIVRGTTWGFRFRDKVLKPANVFLSEKPKEEKKSTPELVAAPPAAEKPVEEKKDAAPAPTANNAAEMKPTPNQAPAQPGKK